MMSKFTQALLLTLGFYLWCSNFSFAENTDWGTLNKNQQNVLQAYQKNWNDIPSDRRLLILKGLKQFQSMQAVDMENANKRFKKWKSLSSEQRKEIRKRFTAFSKLPPPLQNKIRNNYRKFSKLPPETKRNIRQKWKKMTPAQRHKALKKRKLIKKIKKQKNRMKRLRKRKLRN